MNRYVFALLLLLGIVVTSVIDIAVQGVLGFMSYFSLSVFFLMVLLTLNSTRSYVSVFFLFGFLADWFNKSFLGVSSLISVVALYVFGYLQMRVAGNRIANAVLILLASVLFYTLIYGYSLRSGVGAVVNGALVLVLLSPVWARR